MKNRKLLSRLTPAALVAILLVLALAGGTFAWLTVQTPSITNTFQMGAVDVDIVETFVNDVKSNVKLTNPDGPENVPIYVRAALVPTWVDDQGKPQGIAASLTADLNITRGTDNTTTTGQWIYNDGDGYYYYTGIVPVGGETDILIASATVKTANGYHMNLQVIADAVQAAPASAVAQVWPAVTVNTDGTLRLGGGGS